MIENSNPYDKPAGTKVWAYILSGSYQTLGFKEDKIMSLVNEKKWALDRMFRDSYGAGKANSRLAFEQMIYLAGQLPRIADLIIVYDYSDLGRDQLKAHLYRAKLRHNGWEIISINDRIPNGPLSSLYEAILDWKNEQSLIDLRANTRRGLFYIAEQGCLPTGQPCKGYVIIRKQIGIFRDGMPRIGRKPELDPEIAPLVIVAFEMKLQGASTIALANATGLYPPGSSAWSHFFRNRAYIGEFLFQDQIFTNVYPLLVPKELFEAVQASFIKSELKFS